MIKKEGEKIKGLLVGFSFELSSG